MSKNRTILIFNLSILCVLLSLGTCLFFFKIIQNKNEHTSAVVNTLQNKVKEKENAEVLIKKIAEVTVAREKINGYLVNQTQIDSLVDYLENLGKEGNTTVAVKNVELSTQEKNIVLMNIIIEGNFSDIIRTIGLLENMPYQVRITSSYVNLQEGVDRKWQADISFKILTSS